MKTPLLLLLVLIACGGGAELRQTRMDRRQDHAQRDALLTCSKFVNSVPPAYVDAAFEACMKEKGGVMPEKKDDCPKPAQN